MDRSLAVAKSEEKSMVPAQWNLAWEEFGRRYPRLKRGPALLAYFLFTFAGQSVLGMIAYFYVFLPWFVWALVFLSTSTLAQMFVINFSGKAYNRRIAGLEDQFQPKLEITFLPGQVPAEEDHFIQTYPHNGTTAYRIGVTSQLPMDDAIVVANGVRVNGVAHSTVHLHPMHDETFRLKRVKLYPRERRFWEVILKPRDGDAQLAHVEPVLQNSSRVHPAKQEFEILASGGNSESARKIVSVDTDENGTFSFNIR